jgi:hypothetical protein
MLPWAPGFKGWIGRVDLGLVAKGIFNACSSAIGLPSSLLAGAGYCLKQISDKLLKVFRP